MVLFKLPALYCGVVQAACTVLLQVLVGACKAASRIWTVVLFKQPALYCCKCWWEKLVRQLVEFGLWCCSSSLHWTVVLFKLPALYCGVVQAACTVLLQVGPKPKIVRIYSMEKNSLKLGITTSQSRFAQSQVKALQWHTYF